MRSKFMFAAFLFAVATVVPAQATLLQIVSNGAGQQIEVEVGPIPGGVAVTGVNGGSTLLYTGVTSIDLRTGAGQDYVEFRISTSTVPPIAVSTGGNISDVKFIYELPFSATNIVSNITVTGGSVNDTVDFSVIASGDNFTGNWTVNHGAGDNTTTSTINLPEPSTALNLNYTGNSGVGQDTLGLALISGAANLSLSVGGSMGGGNDVANIVVDGLGPAAMATAFNLNLGAGNDAANAEVISRGGTIALSGAIRGATEIDTIVVKAEGNGTFNVLGDGGAGNDLVDFELKGSYTGTPRLLGGLNDDELKIVVDGPLTLTPFIDGGPGIDKAIGFGTIINVEQIN